MTALSTKQQTCPELSDESFSRRWFVPCSHSWTPATCQSKHYLYISNQAQPRTVSLVACWLDVWRLWNQTLEYQCIISRRMDTSSNRTIHQVLQ